MNDESYSVAGKSTNKFLDSVMNYQFGTQLGRKNNALRENRVVVMFYPPKIGKECLFCPHLKRMEGIPFLPLRVREGFMFRERKHSTKFTEFRETG